MTPERRQLLARALKAAARTPLPLPRRGAEDRSVLAACKKAKAAFMIRSLDPESREAVEAYIASYERARHLVCLPVAWVPVMPITDIEVVPDPHYALALV